MKLQLVIGLSIYLTPHSAVQLTSMISMSFTMFTTSEIGNAGEKIVAQALIKGGWSVVVDTKQPGAVDIEATLGQQKLLVQVKAAVSPQAPASLTSEELQRIRSRATKIGAKAAVQKCSWIEPSL